MSYRPKPIDTSKIELSPDILALTEQLAENIHEIWASKRVAEDWKYAPEPDYHQKLHNRLVPYSQLPESEKEYDRAMALETLRVILALGFRIEKLQS